MSAMVSVPSGVGGGGDRMSRDDPRGVPGGIPGKDPPGETPGRDPWRIHAGDPWGGGHPWGDLWGGIPGRIHGGSPRDYLPRGEPLGFEGWGRGLGEKGMGTKPERWGRGPRAGERSKNTNKIAH